MLGNVGIDASGVDLPANCRRTKPRWGASAKQGLERALAEAKRRGDRKIGCEHILRGLLPPSTAPSRASSRPRASTATSSPAGSRAPTRTDHEPRPGVEHLSPAELLHQPFAGEVALVDLVA